jgi:mRNA interferase RelE/StbE
VVSIDDLRELEAAEDAADLAAARQALASDEPTVPHREVLAEFGLDWAVHEIEWAASALRELRKLDKPVARRLLVAVTRLNTDARPPAARPLVGPPAGTMRLRVGDHRVAYVIEDRRLVITVVRLGHRCGVVSAVAGRRVLVDPPDPTNGTLGQTY